MDELDILIDEVMKNDEELSYKKNCQVKRAMRKANEENELSLWWLPLVSCISSYIIAYIFLNNIVTRYTKLNLLLDITGIIYLQSIVVVLVLTFVGLKKLNLRKGARL
ncbi:MAG: hypothetical protein ACRC41_08645 [Sarcina sp.]